MSYSTYISIDSIVQDYINKNAHTGNLNDELVYIAAEEALDLTVFATTTSEYVMLIDLYNQNGALPAHFMYPTSVAYRPPAMRDCTSKNDLQRYFISTINKDFIQGIHINACEKCHKVTCCCETKEWYPIESKQDYVKLVKTPQLATGYSKFMYGHQNEFINSVDSVTSALSHTDLANDSKPLHEKHVRRSRTIPRFARSRKCPEFQMVRPVQNYFFSLPSRLKACNLPNYDTNLEYKIEDGIISINNYRPVEPCKRCNKKCCEHQYEAESSGTLLLSYIGKKVDEKGFLMIPNEPNMIGAITDYIITYMARIQYATTKEQKDERYFFNMKSLSDVSMTKARARHRIPTPDRWQGFIENQWNKRITDNSAENLNRYTREEFELPDQSYMDTTGETEYYNKFYM